MLAADARPSGIDSRNGDSEGASGQDSGGARVTPEAFVAWRRRSLAAARAEEERYAKPEPIPEPKPVVAPVSPRIVAERLFEGDPAADGMLRP